ncbi:hypothetical protein [Qipengyuania sp. MTN3-11]|uniref:hypothetical protein n=1 Tax=Qipengyuania sp. MTN3-11 TaxID=3056557 RepID=UPI0036F2A1B5
MRAAVIPAALLLAACGSQAPDGTESAEDYAARVGASGSAAEGAARPNAAQPVAPPAGSDARRLERLGDISSVNLGLRDGACTFSADGEALLVAAAPSEQTLPGKATVRIGGQLLLLDALPGGLDEVRQGTTFRGEGFTAELARAANDNAELTITDQEGEARIIAGKWACT